MWLCNFCQKFRKNNLRNVSQKHRPTLSHLHMSRSTLTGPDSHLIGKIVIYFHDRSYFLHTARKKKRNMKKLQNFLGFLLKATRANKNEYNRGIFSHCGGRMGGPKLSDRGHVKVSFFQKSHMPYFFLQISTEFHSLSRTYRSVALKFKKF